jgi:hypothetical protein
MPETWELRIERLGMHQRGARLRTYGRYQVWKNGVADPALQGFMCETPGPGDNMHPGNAKRIEAGTYPLWTQFGSYRSIGYAAGGTPGQKPMPAIALAATGRRSGILIHPAHPPNLFLSSIGCFNPSGPLGSAQSMDFFDSRSRVVALLESLKAYAPQAFAHEVMTRIGSAVAIVSGEPTQLLAELAAVAQTAEPEPRSLPISRGAAIQATTWLMDNFGPKIRAAAAGKPYGAKHLCAIVCQETAYKWVPWIGTHSVATIVERAVYDASGDFPETSRSAFPVNTAAFRARYGNALTDMLIEEANKTRRLQNYSDRPWVYKGYGLFQNDLQAIADDEAFFRERRWYSFDTCLAHAVAELDEKLRQENGDLWEAIRAYNGRGPRAVQYRENVRAFTGYCATVTGD